MKRDLPFPRVKIKSHEIVMFVDFAAGALVSRQMTGQIRYRAPTSIIDRP